MFEIAVIPPFIAIFIGLRRKNKSRPRFVVSISSRFLKLSSYVYIHNATRT
jgi:hypothetical protein